MALAAEAAKRAANYREGYRQWHLVQSLVVQKGHEDLEMFRGIHHIYANKTAFEALTKGKPYPDGAVFVIDVLDATEQDNVVTEGLAAAFMIRRYFLAARVGARACQSSSRTSRTVARSSRMSYGLLTKPLAPTAKASLLEPLTE